MITINILKNYTERICGYTTNVFESIIYDRNPKFALDNKAMNLYVIRNLETGKIINLPCVNRIYTTDTKCKMLKIAKNSSHCFNTFKAFDIEASYNDCIHCHRQALEKFNNKQLKLVKK